jgi:hypothetical protein
MRLTFQLLGLELDVTFGPAETASEDDPLRDLGATGHYPVGFVANHDMPDEAAIHRPCSPFEDDSEIRRRSTWPLT